MTAIAQDGTLHVTNGDITSELLSQIGIEAMPWRDALHEGPVVKNGRALRAAFLSVDEAEFAERDDVLDSHTGDYALWFEADLYDQLQIAEILSRLRGRKVVLRQIGEHIGIAHFGGLGQLTPEQIGRIQQLSLSADAIALGAQAWDALTAPNPLGMLKIERSSELRFMREAFIRLAQEYPWIRDGLSLSERRLLTSAPGTKHEMFQRASRKEARPFMGDYFAFQIIDRLAPLLDVTDDVYRLNADGERVLAGEADFVRSHGIDRWIGGVHLTGSDVPWRWDDAREALVG
jgi:hypothetical protein